MPVVPGYSILEKIREDREFRLFRGLKQEDQLPVLIRIPASQYPDRNVIEKIGHEFSLRPELDGPGTIQPLALVRENGGLLALILRDPGGLPLDSFLAPMPLPGLLRIAIGLAGAIGKVHARNLIHKDIKPSNVLVDLTGGTVRLMGFGIASRLPRERQLPGPPQVIAGTLAYMAPEQTGYMNRSVDSRSDLYSFGVTLYEMLTGTLPFTASDPLEWIHCHVARQPIPPFERTRETQAGSWDRVPRQVSDIVMKLLAKTAEERYQTAEGVEADLARCLEEWETQGRIGAFPLGKQDASSRLLIPETLYGRKREIRTLLRSFNRVLTQGVSELVVVSGYSGVGKSSLVNELHKVIVLPRGLFASGKFEQYNRGIPYATLADAIGTLVRQILVKPEEEAARWRTGISEAVAPNGRLLVELVPELEFLIGRQPSVPELSSREAQNRFHAVFRNFLGVFARKEHPLALFLDDLQWLDPASLKLLEHLICSPDLHYLLLIGAYRDNEVTSSHPLMLTLDSIRAYGVEVSHIILAPLSLDGAGRLIAGALPGPAGRTDPLARLMYEKTAGNPFFTIQFLTALYEEGILSFDTRTGAWNWDMDRIQAKGYTDNVADLMASKLIRFTKANQDAMKGLALLGASAGAALLSKVLGIPQERLHEDLWEAVKAGLLIRTKDTYRFLHDRIQEAAYSLTPEESRAGEHLRIGRIILSGKTEAEIEEDIFVLVNHLNRGIALIPDAGEKEILCDLNFRAGRKAKASIAYASARDYLDQAMALLDSDAWNGKYGRAFELTLELAECEYLTGGFARADDLFNLALAKTRSRSDRAKVYGLRMKFCQFAGRFQDAVAVGFEGLDSFGINFPKSAQDMEAAIDEERRLFPIELRGRRIADLADAPEADDPDARAIIALFGELTSPMFITKSKVFPLFILKGVNFSLRYGNTEASCLCYAWNAILHAGIFENIPVAFEFSELAIRLNEKLNDYKLKGYMLFLHGFLIHCWRKPFATGLPMLEEAFVACLNVGDLVYASYIAFVLGWQYILTGSTIEDVLRYSKKYAEFAKQSHNEVIYQMIRQMQQFLACLKGLTLGPASFDDGAFDEAESLAIIAKSGTDTGLEHQLIMKQITAVIHERYDEALDFSLQAEKNLLAVMSSPISFVQLFYHALTLAALYSNASGRRQVEFAKALDEKRLKLRHWADNCPENFLNAYALVSAEVARIEGRDLEAMRLYDQAIRSARENGFVLNESLANEIAGRFYLGRGFETNAHTYLRNARAGYLRWGATGKVKQIGLRYPGIGDEALIGPTATIGAPVDQLDLMTVVKASQAVSGEIVLGKLIEKLLSIAVEHAGAENGLLILSGSPGSDAPSGPLKHYIEANAITGPDRVEVSLRHAPVMPGDIPESLFQYVLRTGENVVLHDALLPNLFSADPYLAAKRPRSVLCMPLARQSKLMGVLYLENNLSPGVFTPTRLSVLNVIASQAAISLENAGFYAQLEDERARLRAVIQQVPAGLAIAEAPSGRMIAANDYFEKILRQPFRTSFTRENYGEYTGFHPDGRRYTSEEWPLARSIDMGEIVQDEEIELLLGDGTRGWINVNSAPIRDVDGKITAGVIIFQDITEKKKSREERESLLGQLREERERLSAILDLMPVPILLLEPGSARVLFANKAAQDLAGGRFPDGEAKVEGGMQSYCTDSQGVRLTAESMPDLRASRGEKFEDFEMEWHRAAGTRSLLINSETLRDKDGNPEIAVLAFQDISPLKQAEQQLRQSQKMEAIGRLTGGIAHDFNNLLAVINGYSAMALAKMDASHPLYDFLREILKAGERAAGLTKQLLVYSRKQILEPKLWNLNTIVSEMNGMFKRLIGEDISLTTALSPQVDWIRADRSQIEQILLNLVVNARDAMPHGGRLEVESATVFLDKIYARLHPNVVSGPYVMLRVSDTGMGMDSETMARIFEPFFTTKEPSKGTGLGLSVVYGIVKQAGARIDVASESGKGTTFRIYFPIAGAPGVMAPEAPQSTPSSYRGNETVLLVEDEESVRKFVSKALESMGYKVLQAGNGREALEKIFRPHDPVHLVITDVVMPDMGGRELIDRLHNLLPGLPVVFISGYLDKAILRKGVNEWEETFLQKPFNPFQLAMKVRESLDRTAAPPVLLQS
ncbi:MAG: hypothetical protein JWO30_3945 [Fibrobacteres bacterium]|nr:hypothetical protein [Fibrobacterota bacterium]